MPDSLGFKAYVAISGYRPSETKVDSKKRAACCAVRGELGQTLGAAHLPPLDGDARQVIGFATLVQERCGKVERACESRRISLHALRVPCSTQNLRRTSPSKVQLSCAYHHIENSFWQCGRTFGLKSGQFHRYRTHAARHALMTTRPRARTPLFRKPCNTDSVTHTAPRYPPFGRLISLTFPFPSVRQARCNRQFSARAVFTAV